MIPSDGHKPRKNLSLTRWQEEALRAMPIHHAGMVYTQEQKDAGFSIHAAYQRVTSLWERGLCEPSPKLLAGTVRDSAGCVLSTFVNGWRLTRAGERALKACDTYRALFRG